MKLGWKSFLCVVALCCASFTVQAAKLEGIEVDEQVRLSNTDLLLNGAGVRKTHFIKAYVASLHLPRRSTHVDEVVQMRGPKRLQMVMLVGVESKEFTKAMLKGMRRNSTEAELSRLQERMHVFEQIIDSMVSVKRGDVLWLDYLPDMGMVLSVNGQTRGMPIVGEDFYGKLLEVFIGAHVSDPPLKQHLLGR